MKINKICCIGAGYVGGPTMAVIAHECPDIDVTLVDVNEEKINAWNGPLDSLPVYEPGLAEIVKIARGRNLYFSNDIKKNIEESNIIFVAVNTPTKTEGAGAGMAADLKYVVACAKDIAKYSKSDKIIVEKSTLPVRTAEKIKEILDENSNGVNFEILSNPEFLAEGTAIQDLFKSDRVLIGGEDSLSGNKAVQTLVDIYANWIPRDKILTTNIWSSELSKLASNAMLAQRISSINSLSALCEKTGAKIEQLSSAIGMDHRIGPHFLKSSVGFGGSCFKKDILNLVYLCKYYGLEEVAEYWHQVVKINNYQKKRFSYKIIDYFKSNINEKTITILGWAFKKNTNDTRESAAIEIAEILFENGAKLNIYDPMVKSDQIFNDILNNWDSKNLNYDVSNYVIIFDSIDKAIFKTDAIAILTEWDEFKNIKWEKIEKSEKVMVFDGRNILEKVPNNIDLISIGS